jgi:hypothetical protein
MLSAKKTIIASAMYSSQADTRHRAQVRACFVKHRQPQPIGSDTSMPPYLAFQFIQGCCSCSRSAVFVPSLMFMQSLNDLLFRKPVTHDRPSL